jgi:hypothetical protein
MPSSSTSTFSEPEEFEAALRRLTDVNLLVTGQGRFRGRLTQVALHRIHLVAADETVSRVAHISMRPNLTLVWWALARHGSQIWCGTPCLAGEFMTLGPGARAYARTEGACRWAGLWISATDLGIGWGKHLATAPCGIADSARATCSSHTAVRTPRARGSDSACHSWPGTAVDPRSGSVLIEWRPGRAMRGSWGTSQQPDGPLRGRVRDIRASGACS